MNINRLTKIRRWVQRKRIMLACMRCRTKKLKCSPFRPCERCVDVKDGACVGFGLVRPYSMGLGLVPRPGEFCSWVDFLLKAWSN